MPVSMIFTSLHFLLLLLIHFNVSPPIKTGCYVIKCTMVDYQKRMDKLPDDSLFIANQKVLEKVGNLKIVSIGNVQSRTVDNYSYYFINLKSRKFATLKSLKNLYNLNLAPLAQKTVGYTFSNDSVFYNNEDCTKSLMSLGGQKVRKYSFISKSKYYKGKHISLYISDKMDRDRPISINPGIEQKFGGNLLIIEMDYEKQVKCTIEFIYRKGINAKYLYAIQKAALQQGY